MADEGEGAATASVDWVDVVDRGGLLHVKEGTYMLFCAMGGRSMRAFSDGECNQHDPKATESKSRVL